MRKDGEMRKITTLALVISLFISCGNEPEKQIRERYKYDIEIVKVRECEYVLWFNGYGSDMEHYEGCENAKHYKSNKTEK